MIRPPRARAAFVLAVALLGAPADSFARAVQTTPGDRSTQDPHHAGHSGAEDPQVPAAGTGQDHSTHQAPASQGPEQMVVRPLTDEDRAAAFPELDGGHSVHDDAVNYFVSFDELEWQAGDGAAGMSWDNRGWIGGDVNRFWFRTAGAGEGGDLHDARVHALYGRAIHRWWDVVLGVRQDFRPGLAQTWAAIGLQGLAPYWFEVEASVYVGAEGRTQVRLETEYELLLTNRLVLQPTVELEINGKSDPEHGTGAGLGSMEAGLRLRYEFRREFAPYVGVAWNRKFFGTADLAHASGEDIGGARVAVGVRVWF